MFLDASCIMLARVLLKRISQIWILATFTFLMVSGVPCSIQGLEGSLSSRGPAPNSSFIWLKSIVIDPPSTSRTVPGLPTIDIGWLICSDWNLYVFSSKNIISFFFDWSILSYSLWPILSLFSSDSSTFWISLTPIWAVICNDSSSIFSIISKDPILSSSTFPKKSLNRSSSTRFFFYCDWYWARALSLASLVPLFMIAL